MMKTIILRKWGNSVGVRLPAEILQQMQLNVGDKATLFIPYHLAYGETGGNGIPPKSNIIFEVEVIEIVK